MLSYAGTIDYVNNHYTRLNLHQDTGKAGDYSTCEGYHNIPKGRCCHVEGSFAKAVGSYSHAGGYATTTNTYATFVTGNYTLNPLVSSDEEKERVSNFFEDSPAFIIGGGHYEKNEDGTGGKVIRRNVYTIDF